MADPTKYVRDYSFTDYQVTLPNRPLPAVNVDEQLDDVAYSLGTAVDAIKDVRRSDGTLQNGIVTADSVTADFQAELAVGVLAALADEVDNLVEAALPNWRGPWATMTAYADNDIASEGGSSYICVVAHISAAAFSTDVSAGRWQIMAQQGAPGPGTGDMLQANNLSDLDDAATALSNLGGTTVGRAVFTAANAAAARTAVGATTVGSALMTAADALAARAAIGTTPDDNENRIINGNMGIWQRGTSVTGTDFAADRWFNINTGGTVTQTRQAFPLGDTLGVIQPATFLRQTVSGQTLASQIALISQRIEGVRSYAGQTITVLGWAKRSSGTGNMAVEVTQQFGTGGASPSTEVFNPPVTVTLGTVWAPFAATVEMPSIVGKTLGTNNNDTVPVRFWTSAGADSNARTNSLGIQTIAVDLWGIHIRVGTWTAADAALYRPRDPGTELALCQRYYQVIPLYRQTGVTYTSNGDTRSRFGFIQATRTAAPVLTVSGTANVIAVGSAGDVINVGLGALSLGGNGATGGAIVGISNGAAFAACGPTMSWGDNGGGGLTVLVDAEL